jgi:hypothetical protein
MLELPPLPADRQRELEYELDQLLPKYFGWKRPPLSRFVVNYVDPDCLAAEMASFACEWFPRLALEYVSYLCETGDEYSASDWAPAIKAMVIDATRAIFVKIVGGPGDRFDRECASEVAAALDRCINGFLVRAHYLEQQRIYAAEQRRLAKERAERAARAKAASVEIEVLAAMAGVSVPLLAEPAQLPATLLNEVGKKKQAAVIVDLPSLMRELRILNANRKPPQKPLELNDPSKLPAQLAAESPPGGPNKKTWEKLLTSAPVRSDVQQHLERFFEEHEHRLKDGIQYLKT